MEEKGLESALLRRAREALEHAVAVTARSKVLVHVSEQLRAKGLTSRCAWCGRFQVGTEWVTVRRMPSFAAFAQPSHTICPACTDELRANGKSV